MLDSNDGWFHAFAIDEDRVIYKGGMTRESIADAITGVSPRRVAMRKTPESRILEVLIELELFEAVLEELGLRHVEIIDDSEEDEDDLELEEDEHLLEEAYVHTLSLLANGQWVLIWVRFGELRELLECESESCVQLNFTSSAELDDRVRFKDLLVPLEIAQALRREPTFTIDTN